MKINVGVIFGGESVEHEISIISANQVINVLDKSKYNVIPIYISKEGVFYSGEALNNLDNFKNLDSLKTKLTKSILKRNNKTVALHKDKKSLFDTLIVNIDVFFPVMHGTKGEDGCIQGMLEILGATYVGCEPKAAANGQDKVFMKNILRDNKIRVVDFTWLYKSDYYGFEEEALNNIKQVLTFPVIVKPACLGSSVGISKAYNEEQLIDAIEEALKYDYKILIEKAVENLIEVNCAVIGDYTYQKTSVIEQVIQNDEILSFNDKYQNSSSKEKGMASTNRIIPANISASLTKEIEEVSKKAFRVLNLAGNTRIDYLIDANTDTLYLNETNTIPGSLAFYLWDKVNLPFNEMCDEMIRGAIFHRREQELRVYTFTSNVLYNAGGTKGSKGKV